MSGIFIENKASFHRLFLSVINFKEFVKSIHKLFCHQVVASHKHQGKKKKTLEKDLPY
jgi:hypothetical protein